MRPTTRIAMKRLGCFLFLLNAPTVAHAQYTINISRTYSAIDTTITSTLPPGGLFQLPQKDSLVAMPGDYVDVGVFTFHKGTDLRLKVFDAVEFYTNHNTRHPLLDRAVAPMAVITFPRAPSGTLSFILRNDRLTSVDVSVTVFKKGTLSDRAMAAIRNYLDISLQPLAMTFVVPMFSVSVEPCGTSNAYSTPNVVICTELLSDLKDKDLFGALAFIELHEVAHTLLNLWSLPGFDNEDVADEFATVLLGHDPTSLDQYIKWLQRHDSTHEALVQLVNGDRHTLSIQRARNVKAASQNPQLVDRWDRLLAPFARPTHQDVERSYIPAPLIQGLGRSSADEQKVRYFDALATVFASWIPEHPEIRWLTKGFGCNTEDPGSTPAACEILAAMRKRAMDQELVCSKLKGEEREYSFCMEIGTKNGLFKVGGM
jgi:hypothetical protein